MYVSGSEKKSSGIIGGATGAPCTDSSAWSLVILRRIALFCRLLLPFRLGMFDRGWFKN